MGVHPISGLERDRAIELVFVTATKRYDTVRDQPPDPERDCDRYGED